MVIFTISINQDGLIFERFDVFLGRLKVLNELCSTSHQIFKLQKVEIGGMGGRVLSEEIKKINEKFRCLYGVFATKTYDCLDERDQTFMKDYRLFMSQVWMLDRKVGQIVSRAFDDCTISSSILKLLKIFDDITFRS